MKHEKLSECTKLTDVTDKDDVARIEELSIFDKRKRQIWITGRSEDGESINVKLFPVKPGTRAARRGGSLEISVIGALELSEQIEPLTCEYCGEHIEPNEPAIWSGGKHYCMRCGAKKYSEPAGEEGLMCTRCGCDIDPDDDIWGFDDDSFSEIDICMCSRCAYITHRYALWEQKLRET